MSQQDTQSYNEQTDGGRREEGKARTGFRDRGKPGATRRPFRTRSFRTASEGRRDAERGDRPARSDRRGDRPFRDSERRFDRSDRSDRPFRDGGRRFEDRSERGSDRGVRSDREDNFERGDRFERQSFAKRPYDRHDDRAFDRHGERRFDRPDRSDRPFRDGGRRFEDRGERGSDRGVRSDREDSFELGGRFERQSFAKRPYERHDDRSFDRRGDRRFDRPDRSDRPFRAGGRRFEDRGERGSDRGVRSDREDNFERGDRFERRSFVQRSCERRDEDRRFDRQDERSTDHGADRREFRHEDERPRRFSRHEDRRFDRQDGRPAEYRADRREFRHEDERPRRFDRHEDRRFDHRAERREDGQDRGRRFDRSDRSFRDRGSESRGVDRRERFDRPRRPRFQEDLDEPIREDTFSAGTVQEASAAPSAFPSPARRPEDMAHEAESASQPDTGPAHRDDRPDAADGAETASHAVSRTEEEDKASARPERPENREEPAHEEAGREEHGPFHAREEHPRSYDCDRGDRRGDNFDRGFRSGRERGRFDERRNDRRTARRDSWHDRETDRSDHFSRYDDRDRGWRSERPRRDGFRDMSREPSQTVFNVLVLGAGASGLLCAAHLVSLGLSVALVDRSRTPGRKLAMAGGGHANFTNTRISPERYISETENFVAPVLDKVGTRQICHVMDVLKLRWEEKEKGKLFLTDTASDLVRALLGRCRRGNFEYFGGEALGEDCLNFVDNEVIVTTKSGLCLTGRRVVLALGSPALPASGSSGIGYAIAQKLGHTVVLPEAALAPLFLAEDSPLLGLQGVSLPVLLKTCDKKISDDLLFTHLGLSGPAALKASLYWEQGEPVVIDFLPLAQEAPFGPDNGAKTVLSALSLFMPRRLAEKLVPEDLADRKCAELSAADMDRVKKLVHAYELLPAGLAGLRQAEVCRGGVNCNEIEPLTFFSRVIHKVSIIGEMLDVTGQLGGYNLHWAFASALLAAQALADKMFPSCKRAGDRVFDMGRGKGPGTVRK